MLKYFKDKKLLLLLFAIFFLIRLPFLNQLNLLHDERDIVLTGYSLAKTGRDLNGVFLPLSFNGIAPKTPFVSLYYSALWWLILPYRSIFFARLPFVFITSFFIFLVYELILLITENKKLSLITSIIFCFSPWVFHNSRLALETNLALVLILLASIFYLKEKKALAFIFFFLTFYSYQAIRVVVPLILVYLEIFSFIKRSHKLLFIKNLGLVFIFVASLFISSIFIDGSLTQSRFKEVVFFNLNTFSKTVDFKRAASTAPFKVRAYFHNKASQAIDYCLNNFIYGQEVSYLFKNGEPNPINGNISTGQFFLFLILFYYLGFIYLGKINKFSHYYPLGFIIVGLSPSILNIVGATYSFRAFISAVGYSYIIAAGLGLFFQSMRKQSKIVLLASLFIFLFLLTVSIVYFSYNYFFRRPLLASELYFENERQLVTYLLKNKQKDTIVYAQHPNELYLTYFFLNKNLDIRQIKPDFTNKNDLKISEVTFRLCTHKTNLLEHLPSIISEGCFPYEDYVNFEKTSLWQTSIPYKDIISQKKAYFILK